MAAQVLVIEQGGQDVARANLRFAEKQRGIDPGIVEHRRHRLGNARRLGHVPVERAHGILKVFQDPASVETQFLERN